MRDPFPDGFLPRSGSSLGLMTFVGQSTPNILFPDMVSSPYTEDWNFGIQRELPGAIRIDAAYVGKRGIHLINAGVLINQPAPEHLALGSQLLDQVPNPFFGLIATGPLAGQTVQRRFLLRPFPHFDTIVQSYVTGASSVYHSFQLKVEKRFTSGLGFLLAYTNAKLIDDNSGGFGSSGVIQNFHDRRAERAISPLDVSQRLVISYVYELPFGRQKVFGQGWNRALDAIFGGWQINGITALQTGTPLAVSAPNTCNCFNPGLRPNMSGSAKLGGSVHSRLDRYFETSVFSRPALFSFGNAPRTLPDVRDPGTTNFDFSLFKEFQPTERWTVQLRAEAFNLFNRPQFGSPNTSLTSPAFGRISSQVNDPRQLQFGLKVLF